MTTYRHNTKTTRQTGKIIVRNKVTSLQRELNLSTTRQRNLRKRNRATGIHNLNSLTRREHKSRMIPRFINNVKMMTPEGMHRMTQLLLNPMIRTLVVTSESLVMFVVLAVMHTVVLHSIMTGRLNRNDLVGNNNLGFSDGKTLPLETKTLATLS
jgi:hypothetical protein